MRSIAIAVLGLCTAVLPFVAPPDPPSAPAIDPALLAVREGAWRAWFAGDIAALRRVLPADFIGIAWGEAPFATLEDTLKASAAFHDAGGRLVQLSFPETRAHRFGDAVVLYGRFEITLAGASGEQTVRGRLTETFVKRDGRWWHPAWHLDAGGLPAGTRAVTRPAYGTISVTSPVGAPIPAGPTARTRR